MKDKEIKQFYSALTFPGKYQTKDITYHLPKTVNRYINILYSNINDGDSIIDLGCGSGLITNIIASKYKNSKITAVDFCNSIKYAESFSKDNDIKNVSYTKKDILALGESKKYDVVMCVGVLHHIPKFAKAVEKIKKLANKKIILSVYHPTGKLLKKAFKIDYSSAILHSDQEEVPFELSWTKKQVLDMFSEYQITDMYPKNPLWKCITSPILHNRNGGLTTYILEKNNEI
jgi:2-polyprenyl-3-methyl-5-hydroxy-6-metoxy-1,4-benzoquinol methylase